MKHLSEVALVDSMEGQGSRSDREHLLACAECASRAKALLEALSEAGAAAMPEPEPAFWGSQRRRIRESLDHSQRGFGWVFLPGLALAGATAMGLFLWLPHVPSARPSPTLPAWSAVPEGEDVAMTALRGLSPAPEDVSLAENQGLSDQIVSLSDDESQALTAALRTELSDSKL